MFPLTLSSTSALAVQGTWANHCWLPTARASTHEQCRPPQERRNAHFGPCHRLGGRRRPIELAQPARGRCGAPSRLLIFGVDDRVGSDHSSALTSDIAEGINEAVRSVNWKDDDDNDEDKETKIEDISRRAISNVKGATEEAIRAATGDEDYQLGDLTRRAQTNLSELAEDSVNAIFDDKDDDDADDKKKERDELISKARSLFGKGEPDRVMSELFVNVVGDYMHNIPGMENLTPTEERDMIIAMGQILALGSLCVNLITNLFEGGTVITAWIDATIRTGASPLTSSKAWGMFLANHSAMRIFTGPVTMPLKVVAAAFLAPRYRDWLLRLQRSLVRNGGGVEQKHRIGAVLLAWLLGNCVCVGMLTVGVLGIATAALGLPFR